ncbi:20591_t:CDS:10 [Cetraspora pellucida]|uniref:ubiquitinyl hydrolase 1 n=1 Tax=Cetraspora pellucida TaxID=1433469 RepID=A0A9N9D9J7_9GLOM|nr:20591_t:CDS:10 [Cetraspora pellucida]
MAVQQDSRPALPPRPSATNEMAFAGCAKTPPSWLTALVHHYEGDKKHAHEFLLSKHFGDGPEIVLICKKCHKRFSLTTSIPTPMEETISQINVERGMCVANRENHLHHLHTTISTKTNVASECCYCHFTVNVVIHEPYIDIQIFDELQKTRPIPTYSNAARKTNGVENEPSILDTLELLSNIINTLRTSDTRRKLNLNSKQFMSRIVYNSASKAFFDKLEYELVDDHHLMPPELTEDYIIKSKHVSEEIDMRIMDISENEQRHRTSLPFNPTTPTRSSSSSCTTLGCVSDMDDKILEWAYTKAIEESKEKIPEYLQAIFELSKERKSESLGSLVAVQRSIGNFSEDDVNEAYQLMKADRSVTDQQLIEAYYYTSDGISAKHREALTIIGRYRNSQFILSSLNERGSNEVYMSDYFSDMPVGLDNIGNTCYLNSLLQYYFTIRNLREAVLSADTSSVNSLDNDWESLTSGGRKVSKSEVERAKKFVSLLRDLFKELMHTPQRSIAPDFDLAYLALVNAKNDDEYKETTKSPMDTSTNSDMIMDDASPGPSAPTTASAINYSEMTDSSSSPAEEEVLMSGVSPNCADQDTLFRSTNGPYQTEDDTSTSHSLKGKEKEDNFSTTKPYGPELPDDQITITKEDKLKTASSMLFGKQQDVTGKYFKLIVSILLKFVENMFTTCIPECMDNVMFQLQAALKVTIPDQNGEQQNIVERPTYRRACSKYQRRTIQSSDILNISFSVFHYNNKFVVAEGRDLYDGLDVCFDTSTVEFDGTQAQRDVTLTRVPPILQIQVQRVQFDRSTSNVYKSNAYLRLEKVIYLDRYLDKHHERLREKRRRAHEMKQEIESLQTELSDLTQDKTTFLPTVDLLKFTSEFVRSIKDDDSDFIFDENFDRRLSEIELERQRVNERIDDIQHRITSLRNQLKGLYLDMKECVYRLHAVFIHSGQATFGHYWIYIYDFEKDRWLKYNDSYVTKVDEDSEVFADLTGKTANPYCMVYVRAQADAQQLVDTICRKTIS